MQLLAGDFGRSADVRRVVEEAAAHFGGLDGLVNNAGGMLGRVPYAEMTDEQYDRVMDLNARSVVTACHAAIPFLRRQGGFIVNTSSVAARNGGGGGAGLYASSKAFVSNYTRGLAKELIGDGIRVNAVAPGVIATPFHERYSTPAQMEAMVAGVPQGRVGTAGRLRRRLSVPVLGRHERLRGRPGDRGEWRPADAVTGRAGF